MSEAQQPSPFTENELEYGSPDGMPMEIWWDKSEGAEVRRAKWLLENLKKRFALQDNVIKEALELMDESQEQAE